MATALTIARAYQHSFETHPNTTLAITGGCLNALGDFVAQVSQNTWRKEHEEYRRYDFARSLRFFCYGFTISPLMGRWNRFLESRFPLRTMHIKRGRLSSKISLKGLTKRVACDQLIVAPIGLAIFLGSMGIMEARSPRQIRDKFKDLYQTVLIANWKVWPAAQFINFRYTPPAYRVPFSQACGVFWTLYLSIMNSEEDKKDKENAARETLSS